MPPVQYNRTAIALHWFLALLLVTMIGLGLYMTELPRDTPERGWYFNLHKSLGVLAAFFILLRVIGRSRVGVPPHALALPRWQRAAGYINHGLLYLCMVSMPLTGYLGSSFGKFGVKFFDVPLPPWAWEDRQLQEIFVSAHYFISRLFIVLIAIHVAAALYHLYRRDGVFARMWPRSRPARTLLR